MKIPDGFPPEYIGLIRAEIETSEGETYVDAPALLVALDEIESLRRMLKTTRDVVADKQIMIDEMILAYAELSPRYLSAVKALQEISIVAFQHGGCKQEALESIIDEMKAIARKALKGEK